MTLLTDEEISRICLEWPGNATQAARAIESAVLSKLSKGWVMPEALPAMKWQHHMYTELQLREAFASGAASQLSAEPVGEVDILKDRAWVKLQEPCELPNGKHKLFTKVTL